MASVWESNNPNEKKNNNKNSTAQQQRNASKWSEKKILIPIIFIVLCMVNIVGQTEYTVGLPDFFYAFAFTRRALVLSLFFWENGLDKWRKMYCIEECIAYKHTELASSKSWLNENELRMNKEAIETQCFVVFAVAAWARNEIMANYLKMKWMKQNNAQTSKKKSSNRRQFKAKKGKLKRMSLNDQSSRS